MPKGAMAPKGDQKRVQSESEFTKNYDFGGSCAQGLILTCFLSNLEAIYATNGFKNEVKNLRNNVLFEANSKTKNCVSTAPARADRGSDPPENPKKPLKKQSTNRHTYKPDSPPKNTSKDPLKSM